jgi:hypothetical protein
MRLSVRSLPVPSISGSAVEARRKDSIQPTRCSGCHGGRASPDECCVCAQWGGAASVGRDYPPFAAIRVHHTRGWDHLLHFRYPEPRADSVHCADLLPRRNDDLSFQNSQRQPLMTSRCGICSSIHGIATPLIGNGWLCAKGKIGPRRQSPITNSRL